MEASALPASVGLTRSRIAFAAPLLRIRSDEQLVSLFRAGNEEAFRVIHDRYRPRLLAYTRQMLAGSRQDAEDSVQEIFVRAYGSLRVNDRDLALRAWLYRIAHNRCIDELRRPHPPIVQEIDTITASAHDPVAKVEQRDALRRLIADVRRLPEHQRSALLMRELGGIAYADLAGALGVSVPAVKSLLVRARVGLAQASEARDTACTQVRDDVISAHDRGVRTSGLARRHMRDCASCREFRSEVRGVSRQFAALAPALGPAAVIANLLGWGTGGGGAAAGSGAVVGTGAAAAGSGAAAGTSACAAGGGAAVSAGVLSGGAGHVATLLAAAVLTAGGAVEIQGSFAAPARQRTHHHSVAAKAAPPSTSAAGQAASVVAVREPGALAPISAPLVPASVQAATRASVMSAGAPTTTRSASGPVKSVPLSARLDPDRMMYTPSNPTAAPGSTTAATPATGPGSPSGMGATRASGAITATGGPGAGSSGTGVTGTGTPDATTPGSSGTGPITAPSGAGIPGAGTGGTAPGAGTPPGGTSGSGGAGTGGASAPVSGGTRTP